MAKKWPTLIILFLSIFNILLISSLSNSYSIIISLPFSNFTWSILKNIELNQNSKSYFNLY